MKRVEFVPRQVSSLQGALVSASTGRETGVYLAPGPGVGTGMSYNSAFTIKGYSMPSHDALSSRLPGRHAGGQDIDVIADQDIAAQGLAGQFRR